MKTKLLVIALLLLASCTDPKKPTEPPKKQSNTPAPTSLSSTVMTPITTPLQSRKHLRQQIRKINHKSQLRTQQLNQIQSTQNR